MEYLMGWAALSFVAAIASSSRGRSPVIWFNVSLLLSPVVGLIAVLVMKNLDKEPSNTTQERCLYCREWVLRGAVKCKHCGSALPTEMPHSQQHHPYR